MKNRVVRMGIAALMATAMAGSSVHVLLRAMGLPCGAAQAYLPALAAAVLCGLMGLGGKIAVGAGVLAVLTLGGAVGASMDGLSAVGPWLASWGSGNASDAATLSSACGVLALMLGVLLGAGLYGLLQSRSGTPFALMIGIAVLIGSYALNEKLSFVLAVPGMIASLTAFALSGELARDADSWRPALCAAAAVGLALLLLPAGNLTWEPLERAAERVRATFESYLRFTEERVPFTISTEGYNHAAEENGSVVARLGGPANPNPDAVMRVTTDRDVLLRGAVRRTYTGDAWKDDDAKARYLYYDFTRRHVREAVFSMYGDEAFDPVNASVEFLSEGTSALFVPGRLEDFQMDMEDAVYYNSIGEMFLSRETQAGDRYAVTGWQPGNEEALREAVAVAADEDDGEYDKVCASCLQLPDGIEQGVYALAAQLTQNLDNPYDQALSIQNWLRENCVYTLTPVYPDDSRDFVSEFVLTHREGYCSYFASAMTVMCRMAGLPARYAEGYYVRSDGANPVTVTGENAHAWTEVYFRGVGWVAFNPANGAGGGEDGRANEGIDDGDTADDAFETPVPDDGSAATPEPTQDPGATLPPDDGMDPEPSESPDPQAGDAQSENTPTPPPWTDENRERDWSWLWKLLAILLILILLALAVLLVWKRLNDADPVRLCAREKDAQRAAMILYRSILTMLIQTGQAPLSGETPGSFARRVCAQTKNPDFIVFADAVSMSVYARSGVTKTTVDIGLKAYHTFEKGLKKGERLRYALVRVTKGLGDFDVIP